MFKTKLAVYVGLGLLILGASRLNARTLSSEVIDAMTEAIQDEYKAEQTYEAVLEDFGSVRPFKNIIKAERRHAGMLADLFEKYELEVPESVWDSANVPRFESVAQACEASVQAEKDNAAIYEGYLELDLPDDVREVFEYNMNASLNNHLPAFERCGSGCGGGNQGNRGTGTRGQGCGGCGNKAIND
ncbi:DUF2202 domain-containing protein [candidate division WOR-3 bacterium]|uniref:DUF2202 domain-containing protein n=1 Tax=candidate division WOR-3 bacterium TaxID=2052148 RepID=A0A9D5K922_UNCW3|nr:DUF2202 domain-containing protein [candidate division WOR-3 bacterium]MBD3364612.1 DUF2202 domain-containing protein [candidate division WOR-3 bacterium]